MYMRCDTPRCARARSGPAVALCDMVASPDARIPSHGATAVSGNHSNSLNEMTLRRNAGASGGDAPASCLAIVAITLSEDVG